MVASATKRAIDTLTRREPSRPADRAQELRARWLTDAAALGAADHAGGQRLQRQWVEQALASDTLDELRALELLANPNLEPPLQMALREALTDPRRPVAELDAGDEAALLRLERHEIAQYVVPVPRANRLTPEEVAYPYDLGRRARHLSEAFGRYRKLRVERAASDVEAAAITAALAAAGARAKAALEQAGDWQRLTAGSPIALVWLGSADFANWVMPYTSVRASVDGLRAWLRAQLATDTSR